MDRAASDSRPTRTGTLRGYPTGVLLAAAACVLDLLLFSSVAVQGQRLPAGVVIGYAMVGYAVLVWHRRAPVAVFAVLWLHSVAAALTPQLHYFPTIGVLVALFSVAAYRPAATARLGLLAYALPVALNVADTVRADGDHQLVYGLSMMAMLVAYGMAAWAGGQLVATTRRLVETTRSLGQARLREAVGTERLRIARELHDIVAHAVTVMVLQAAGAHRVLCTRPAWAAQALTEIEGTGKQAMDELRRLLSVLRTGVDDDGAVPSPQPGLADLDRLVTGVRGTGVPVLLRTEGDRGRLDAGVDLTAYRVVQEALTNVTKHAPRGADATVTLHWAGEVLTVGVVNGGRGGAAGSVAAALSSGYGLRGLRERVTLVGGEFTAHPTGDGGFAVTATLPVAIPADRQKAGSTAKEMSGDDHPHAAGR